MIGFILILVGAAIFPGIILRVKAVASGRKGAGLWQPWKDMWRSVRKGSVYSTTSSFVFQIATPIYFTGIWVAALLVPFADQASVLSFEGDVVVFAYLLALGRFLMIIAALDTGSPFEGMGANREAFYATLVEPAFFIFVGSLAMFTGYTSFSNIYQHLFFENYISYLIGVFATYLLVQMAMVENSRLPVDDPTTHLELTMVHEVMILDNSGVDLAMIQGGSALKFSIYGMLVANFFLQPHALLSSSPVAIGMNAVLFLGIQVLFAVAVGLLESFRARFKMNRNPQFIMTLSAVGIIIFFTVLLLTQKIA